MIENYKVAVDEMLRVLKGGGILFIDVRNHKNASNIREDRIHKSRFHGVGSFKRKLKNFVKSLLKKGFFEGAIKPYMFLNNMEGLNEKFEKAGIRKIICYGNDFNVLSLSEDYSKHPNLFLMVTK